MDLSFIAERFQVENKNLSSILSQKRVIEKIQKKGREFVTIFSTFAVSLGEDLDCNQELSSKINQVTAWWSVLINGKCELEAFEQFIFEITSVSEFLSQVDGLLQLSKGLSSLTKDINRFNFLFNEIEQRSQLKDKEEFLIGTERPNIGQLEQVKNWLAQSKSIY